MLLFKQTLSCAGFSGIVSPDPFMVGGDLRSGNDRYFQGKIKSVAVYSDLRTADEIKADVTKVDTSDAALLLAYDLTASGDARLKDASKNANDLVYYNPQDAIQSLEGMKFDTNTTYYISKPFDKTGNVLANWYEKALYPVIISLISLLNNTLMLFLTIQLPKL